VLDEGSRRLVALFLENSMPGDNELQSKHPRRGTPATRALQH
jgi:hypothetical protein